MSFILHTFGSSVTLVAETGGLVVRGPSDLTDRRMWPSDAKVAPGGWASAVEIEQLIETGFAEALTDAVMVPYSEFKTIGDVMQARILTQWVKPSRFLLKIERNSDIGRPDFSYKYSFVLDGQVVGIERAGYYVRRSGRPEVFILDDQMFALVEAMDAFNGLSPAERGPQASWLAFAKVKGCATEVGAELDATLAANSVLVPSEIGLYMREDVDGGLTFLPTCPELAGEELAQVFDRNDQAEGFYSLDRPGLSRVRIVLTNKQREVLRRMKQVKGIKGKLKDALKENPAQVFDGVLDDIEIAYGSRVIGVGDFEFTPTPRPATTDSTMSTIWTASGDTADAQVAQLPTADEIGADRPEGPLGEGRVGESSQPTGSGAPCSDGNGEAPVGKGDNASARTSDRKYLLIDTNEESVRPHMLSEADSARRLDHGSGFERPKALREDRLLRPHQEDGVRWLQTCSFIRGRKGVLLADDMGVGKTVQVLTFLAWCIESGRFPDLSKQEPPFRPILIVAPLMLVGTRTWEAEMERFFAKDGVVFWPKLSLHGDQVAKLRLDAVEGAEVELGKPVLNIRRIQDHRVVVTNYETVKNYQHSFACLQDGKPIWSFIVSDEAQEYKVPNTKVSHAMKALNADLHIACTGTPVENRLLDLWNVCDTIQPGLLSSSKDFVDRFERNLDPNDPGGALGDLKRELLFQQPHAFLLRRTKSDVADLPPKTVIPLYCEMSDLEVKAHSELLQALHRDERRSKYLTALQAFVQLYQHPALLEKDAEDQSVTELVRESSKLRAVIETLHQIREKREKVIIFARVRAMQTILSKVLEAEFGLPVRIINGDTQMHGRASRSSTGQKTRNAILDDFRQRPGFNILVLSPFVAGIGLTIVEANHVVHYGRWWNPALESQATDRAYRIGQAKPVTVYLPILRDRLGRVSPSFDERLHVLMDRKQRLAEDFLRPLGAEDDLGRELLSDLATES